MQVEYRFHWPIIMLIALGRESSLELISLLLMYIGV